MKQLNNPIMRGILKRAVRKAKRIAKPSEGYMIGLLHGELGSKGNHYQAEYINDSRNGGLRVTVYMFKGLAMHCRSADYYLTQKM